MTKRVKTQLQHCNLFFWGGGQVTENIIGKI